MEGLAVGRIVQYVLSASDAEEINRRRHPEFVVQDTWPEGAQAHTGNTAAAGDVLPMIVCRVWGEAGVNGQVFLDGNDTFWATSRHEGDEPGTWHAPKRL
jgi:hypothetical protein